jgi:5-methylcytosine-specific restriction endonuclease McrA
MAILKRDKERCIKCGRNGKETLLEVDHIIPVAEGGKTIAENLQTLCSQCNIGKLNIFAG